MLGSQTNIEHVALNNTTQNWWEAVDVIVGLRGEIWLFKGPHSQPWCFSLPSVWSKRKCRLLQGDQRARDWEIVLVLRNTYLHVVILKIVPQKDESDT